MSMGKGGGKTTVDLPTGVKDFISKSAGAAGGVIDANPLVGKPGTSPYMDASFPTWMTGKYMPGGAGPEQMTAIGPGHDGNPGKSVMGGGNTQGGGNVRPGGDRLIALQQGGDLATHLTTGKQMTEPEPPGGGGGGPGTGGGGTPGGGGGAPGKSGGNTMAMNPNAKEGSFLDPWIKGVAGPSGLETYAGDLVGKLGGDNPWATKATSAVDAAIAGAGEVPQIDLVNSPQMKAVQEQFKASVIPQIMQHRALSGLADSNAPEKDIEQAYASALPNVLSQVTGLQENAINRKTSAGLTGANLYSGIGSGEFGRIGDTINAAMGVGGTMRGIANQLYEAINSDFLRRQGLTEEMILAGLGQAGAAAGSSQKGWNFGVSAK